MKKTLVKIIVMIMVVVGIMVLTGCGKTEEKEMDYHGYYGDSAWSACESAYEEYRKNGVEVTEITEEFIYGERYYVFYTIAN